MNQQNWISITEKLPTLDEPVLFCCYLDEHGCSDVQLGWYEGKKTQGAAIAMETLGNEWYPCTHWMALPSVPEVP